MRARRGRAREGAAEPSFDLFAEPAPRLRGEPILYVAIGDSATAAEVGAALSRAEALALRPLVVFGPIPGHPQRPTLPPEVPEGS